MFRIDNLLSAESLVELRQTSATRYQLWLLTDGIANGIAGIPQHGPDSLYGCCVLRLKLIID